MTNKTMILQRPFILQLFFVLSASWFSLAWAKDYAFIGDAGEWNSNSQAVRDSILKAGVREVFIGGDNLYASSDSYEKHWDPWREKALDFSAVAIGNHHSSYADEMKYFKMPNEFYKKEFSDVTVLVLNSDNTENIKKQMAWLEGELKSVKQSVAKYQKPLFILFHHPPLTMSPLHKWQEKSEFQIAFRDLAKKYEDVITALLLGHDHFAAAYTYGDLVAIISGAVKNLRVSAKTEGIQEGLQIKTHFVYSATPAWVKISVGPGGKNTSSANDKSTVRISFVQALNQKTLCEFSIVKNRMTEVSKTCLANSKSFAN